MKSLKDWSGIWMVYGGKKNKFLMYMGLFYCYKKIK